MKKVICIMLCGAFLFASCGTYAGSGAYAGASLGGMLGSAVGGITGGYRGSDMGTLFGAATGAMIGGTMGAAVDQQVRVERYMARRAAKRMAKERRLQQRYDRYANARARIRSNGNVSRVPAVNYDDVYTSGTNNQGFHIGTERITLDEPTVKPNTTIESTTPTPSNESGYSQSGGYDDRIDMQ